MTLRISSKGLRIRISSDEARRLLAEGILEEEFRVLRSENYHCSIRFGDPQLLTEENGIFCWISKQNLRGALEVPLKRTPIESFSSRRGYSVSVDIDVFERG